MVYGGSATAIKNTMVMAMATAMMMGRLNDFNLMKWTNWTMTKMKMPNREALLKARRMSARKVSAKAMSNSLSSLYFLRTKIKHNAMPSNFKSVMPKNPGKKASRLRNPKKMKNQIARQILSILR